MILPFDDVFQRRSWRRPAEPESAKLRNQLESSRRLREDIRTACFDAVAAAAAARATLARASESDRIRGRRGW